MVTAAATAVGINMTFLLPYSMLRKGWGREHRGLATFDLSLGLFLPFFLATTCVVIASASQFHGEYDEGLLDPAKRTALTEKLQGAYDKNLSGIQAKLGEAKEPNDTDKQLAAMLVSRDAFQLAGSLENLNGNKAVSQIVFGIGVLGMALSTIIILMLINGFAVKKLSIRRLAHWSNRRRGKFASECASGSGAPQGGGVCSLFLCLFVSFFVSPCCMQTTKMNFLEKNG